MIVPDRRLRVLHELLGLVEGDDVARVEAAIRQHRRALEDRRDEADYPTAFAASPSADAPRDESGKPT